MKRGTGGANGVCMAVRPSWVGVTDWPPNELADARVTTA
jgi:hypothetical protein